MTRSSANDNKPILPCFRDIMQPKTFTFKFLISFALILIKLSSLPEFKNSELFFPPLKSMFSIWDFLWSLTETWEGFQINFSKIYSKVEKYIPVLIYDRIHHTPKTKITVTEREMWRKSMHSTSYLSISDFYIILFKPFIPLALNLHFRSPAQSKIFTFWLH